MSEFTNYERDVRVLLGRTRPLRKPQLDYYFRAYGPVWQKNVVTKIREYSAAAKSIHPDIKTFHLHQMRVLQIACIKLAPRARAKLCEHKDI